ncbi:MAG: hypothetical protein LUE64_04095, partial [Candidatus Gastranaerophilales bacterium]|nr:hypothetical protein [Candidatus Gastranaerophilales bacterium]
QNSKLRFFDKFPFFNFLCSTFALTKTCNKQKRNINSFPAFTLAETLITLAIIGVVAAMTIPSVLNHYREQVVETRLAKFYSVFNEGIKLAELEHGSIMDWYLSNENSTTSYDEEGNTISGSNAIDNWFSTYLSNFIVTERTLNSDGSVTYRLNDGSAFKFVTGTTMRNDDIYFFPGGNPDECTNMGVCYFVFNLCPNCTEDAWEYLYGKGLEPYLYKWDGDEDSLLNDSKYGCNNKDKGAYCTALIARNGWKIPKNYPYKVRP